jgi:hypothetical protein
MAKLSEDKIKWILSLDASGAEKSVNELSTANKTLENRNKELRKSMTDLEASGKKESEMYKNLSTELKSNNAVMASNKQQMKLLDNQMGINAMSMSQLKNRAKDLQSQLDHTSQALHPEEYNKLQKEVGETRDRMNELKTAGKNVEDQMSKSVQSGSMWGTFMGNVLSKAVDKLGEMVTWAKDFAKEGIRMAGEAEGVERAFNKMANAGDLENLRESTKGTVDNLTLMKNAVQANNFGIPIQQLGKYLEFAKQRAQDTGQSVDYLVNSIVTGVGRKSPLILDNLGLSIIKINKAVSETGDFIQGVGQIVDEELAKTGAKIETEADKSAQQAARIANIQLALGQRLTPIASGLKSAWGGVLSVFEKWVAIPISEKLSEEKNEMNDLVHTLMAAGDNTRVRNNMIQQLNEKYPEFLKNLNTETMTNSDLARNLALTNKEYERKIRNAVAMDLTVTPLQKKYNSLIVEEETIHQKLNRVLRTNSKDLGVYLQTIIKTGQYASLTDAQIEKIGETMHSINPGESFSHTMKEWLKQARDLPGQIEGMGTALESAKARIEKDNTPASSTATPVTGSTEEDTIADTSKNMSEKNSVIKQKLDEQTSIYLAAQAQVKQAYLSQKDETLLTEDQYNAKMEELAIANMQAKMAIYGVTALQSQELADKLLEIKVKMLQDIRYAEQKDYEEGLKEKQRQEDELVEYEKGLADKEAQEKDLTKKENEQRQKDVEAKLKASLDKQVNDYKQYGSAIGTALGNVLSGQEDMLSAFGDAMIDILFDVLSNIVDAQITELVAVELKGKAKSLIEALAMPDSVATLGAAGFAKAAVTAGLMTTAMVAAKTALKNVIKKKGGSSSSSSTPQTGSRTAKGLASGGYMIQREQDGRMFDATYDPMKRGYVNSPTVIVGEGPKSREWVASNDAVSNPTIAPILDLLDRHQQAGTIRTLDLNRLLNAKAIGMASGGSIVRQSVSPGSSSSGSVDSEDLKLLRDVLVDLKKNGVSASVMLTDFEKKQSLRDRSRKIGSKN